MTTIGRNRDVTEEGWYILSNALHHAAHETGWAFVDSVKDQALGYADLLPIAVERVA